MPENEVTRIVSANQECRYEVEGCGPIIAIITRVGPNIAAQGAVESMIHASGILDGIVDDLEPRESDGE